MSFRKKPVIQLSFSQKLLAGLLLLILDVTPNTNQFKTPRSEEKTIKIDLGKIEVEKRDFYIKSTINTLITEPFQSSATFQLKHLKISVSKTKFTDVYSIDFHSSKIDFNKHVLTGSKTVPSSIDEHIQAYIGKLPLREQINILKVTTSLSKRDLIAKICLGASVGACACLALFLIQNRQK